MLRSTAPLAAAITAALIAPTALQAQPVSSVAELRAAVAAAATGDVIDVAPGNYVLDSSLQVRSGITLRGAGQGLTTFRADDAWRPAFGNTLDDGTNFERLDASAYLIDLGRDISSNSRGFTLEGVTLSGPNLYGGIAGIAIDDVTVNNVEFNDFGWSGVRFFSADRATFTNNTFINSGGRAFGTGATDGPTGGGLNISFLENSTITGNRFVRTPGAPRPFFGVKGREFRDVEIANNTIDTSFAIELPFELDRRVTIENNFLDGLVSIPRFNGGELAIGPDGTDDAFLIRNNIFTSFDGIEGPRNNLRVEDNLFSLNPNRKTGNTQINFRNGGNPPIEGPVLFSGNYIDSVGRGIFASEQAQEGFTFTNNTVRLDESEPNPVAGPLFNFRPVQGRGGPEDAVTDFSMIEISNNVFEFVGDESEFRELFGNGASFGAIVQNNDLEGITFNNAPVGFDFTGFNTSTGAPRGAGELRFRAGVDGEYIVDGFDFRLIPEPASAALLACAAPLALRRRRTP